MTYNNLIKKHYWKNISGTKAIEKVDYVFGWKIENGVVSVWGKHKENNFCNSVFFFCDANGAEITSFTLRVIVIL